MPAKAKQKIPQWKIDYILANPKQPVIEVSEKLGITKTTVYHHLAKAKLNFKITKLKTPKKQPRHPAQYSNTNNISQYFD